ncbi:MAG: response regulator transcription factor [Bacteriovoracaceae bacterium]|nr:response regulator transcription factor [Bacteriovoracaceae bacterium]
MDTSKKVWVYDETDKLTKSIMVHLELRYNAKQINAFPNFLEQLKTETPEVLVIYFDYQNQNFLKLMQTNYFKDKNIPLIVVSEIDDIDLIQFMYGLGVIDYQVYPFNVNLLLSKISLVLNNNLKFISRQKSQLEQRLQNLDLTFKESKILKLFMDAQDYKIHRDTLVNEIWGEMVVHFKTLDVHLYNLRRKIQKAELEIRSEGAGYFTLVVAAKEQKTSTADTSVFATA